MRHDEFSRRRFLAGLAAMGGVAALPGGVMNAQGRGGRGAAPEAAAAPAGPPFRIDTHAHFASPKWMEKNIASKRAGFQALMNWTPAKAIEDMDKAQIKTAVLSSTQPGVTWGDNFEAERAESIAIARDTLAKVKARPGDTTVEQYQLTYLLVEQLSFAERDRKSVV